MVNHKIDSNSRRPVSKLVRWPPRHSEISVTRNDVINYVQNDTHTKVYRLILHYRIPEHYIYKTMWKFYVYIQLVNEVYTNSELTNRVCLPVLPAKDSHSRKQAHARVHTHTNITYRKTYQLHILCWNCVSVLGAVVIRWVWCGVITVRYGIRKHPSWTQWHRVESFITQIKLLVETIDTSFPIVTLITKVYVHTKFYICLPVTQMKRKAETHTVTSMSHIHVSVIVTSRTHFLLYLYEYIRRKKWKL